MTELKTGQAMLFVLLSLWMGPAAVAVSPASASSVEPKNPVTLCERFIAPQTKEACEQKIKKWGPDWYLASVCEKQFDDPLFFECLQLSQSKNFSPVSLQTCNTDGMPDQERLACLKKVGISAKGNHQAFQDSHLKGGHRTPASRVKKILPAKKVHTPVDIGSDPN